MVKEKRRKVNGEREKVNGEKATISGGGSDFINYFVNRRSVHIVIFVLVKNDIMKYLKRSLFVIAVFVTMDLSSCKKGDDTPAGVSFQFDSTTAVKFLNPAGTYGTSTGEFELTATNRTNATLQLFVTSNLAVGSFDIASGAAAVVYASPSTTGSDNLIAVPKANSGTIVITSYTSTTVAGKFSFSGTDLAGKVYTVTNGTFTTSYSKVNTIPLMF